MLSISMVLMVISILVTPFPRHFTPLPLRGGAGGEALFPPLFFEEELGERLCFCFFSSSFLTLFLRPQIEIKTCFLRLCKAIL